MMLLDESGLRWLEMDLYTAMMSSHGTETTVIRTPVRPHVSSEPVRGPRTHITVHGVKPTERCVT